jgi:hypothetical protein
MMLVSGHSEVGPEGVGIGVGEGTEGVGARKSNRYVIEIPTLRIILRLRVYYNEGAVPTSSIRQIYWIVFVSGSNADTKLSIGL